MTNLYCQTEYFPVHSCYGGKKEVNIYINPIDTNINNINEFINLLCVSQLFDPTYILSRINHLDINDYTSCKKDYFHNKKINLNKMMEILEMEYKNMSITDLNICHEKMTFGVTNFLPSIFETYIRSKFAFNSDPYKNNNELMIKHYTMCVPVNNINPNQIYTAGRMHSLDTFAIYNKDINNMHKKIEEIKDKCKYLLFVFTDKPNFTKFDANNHYVNYFLITMYFRTTQKSNFTTELQSQITEQQKQIDIMMNYIYTCNNKIELLQLKEQKKKEQEIRVQEIQDQEIQDQEIQDQERKYQEIQYQEKKDQENQEKKDQEKKDQERKEQDRKYQERKDQEKKDQEKKDQERKEQERKEQERKEQERKEQERKEQERSELLHNCCICLESINGIFALTPCGHTNVCLICFENMRKSNTVICPTCRQNVNNHIRIYI
jgi:hypothetical protein